MYAQRERLYSLRDADPGFSVHPLVIKVKHMAAKKIAADEGAVFFSVLLPISQFANIWLAIKHADSKKVINQYVSLSESSLCPCCKQNSRLTLNSRYFKHSYVLFQEATYFHFKGDFPYKGEKKNKYLDQVIQSGRSKLLLCHFPVAKLWMLASMWKSR